VSVPAVEKDRPGEVVAGLLAASSIAVSAIAIAHEPFKLAPAGAIVALIAVGIGGRHRGLATFAVGFAGFAWLLGMTIAVWTDSALY
jgi:hypothetical protein